MGEDKSHKRDKKPKKKGAPVALASRRTDTDLVTAANRHHDTTKLVTPLVVAVAVAIVLIAAVPALNSVKSTFIGIAGTDTNFDFGVGVRFGVELLVGGGLGAKALGQRRRLKDQRRQIRKYEQMLGIADGDA